MKLVFSTELTKPGLLQAPSFFCNLKGLKSQPISQPYTHTILQKSKKCQEMGRSGSKININQCTLHHLSRYGSWCRPFRSKLILLTSYEKCFFQYFPKKITFFENIRNAKNINQQRQTMSGTGPRHIMVWAIFSRSCIHPQTLIVILIIFDHI